MKKWMMMCVIAVMSIVACNKKQTPPEQTQAQRNTVIEEERNAKMQAMEEERQRNKENRNNKTTAEQDPNAVRAAEESLESERLSYQKVTVVDESDQNGCGFMLKLYNGRKMLPDNLPVEHKSHGKALWVKYNPSSQQTSCNAGKSVHLVDIQIRNPNGE